MSVVAFFFSVAGKGHTRRGASNPLKEKKGEGSGAGTGVILVLASSLKCERCARGVKKRRHVCLFIQDERPEYR